MIVWNARAMDLTHEATPLYNTYTTRALSTEARLMGEASIFENERGYNDKTRDLLSKSVAVISILLYVD